MKGYNNFSYLWKSERDIPNNLREIFLKHSKFTMKVLLINFFATQQFRSFWWLIFPSILRAIFEFRSYIWPQLLRVKSHANEEKCKEWYQQRFAYKYPYGLISYKKSRKSTLLVNYLIRPHTTTNFHLHTAVTATIGHFRVARSLCFKARLNSKLLIRIGFFFSQK